MCEFSLDDSMDFEEQREPLYLYGSNDGHVVIMRDDFNELVASKDGMTIWCRDSEVGIRPFLVADDSISEDVYDADHPDKNGVSHIFPELPLPKHFGLTSDDSLLELSPAGPNGEAILKKFNWCIFTPYEDDDADDDVYELRFATTTREDAEFVSKTLGCVDPLLIPVADVAFEVV